MHQRHLLILASWYPSKSNPYNGDFVQRIALASKQFAQVTVLHFAYTNDKKYPSKLEINKHNGIEEWIYYQKKYPFKAINQLLFIWKALDLLKKIEKQRGKVNSCNVQVIWRMGLVGLVYKRLYRIPYSITEHWTGYMREDFQLQSKYMLWLSQYCAINATKVIAVSLPLAKSLQKVLKLKKPVQILSNIVNSTSINYAPIGTKITFIHVSNFRDIQKNVSGIVNAFAKAYTQNNQLHLKLIGTENKKLLEELTFTYKLPEEAYTFMGTLNHEQTLKEIGQSHALISFSNFETFALTCAEAISVGTPVIYTACGGPESYLSESMGIVTPKNDAEALANNILYMATNLDLFNRNQIKSEAQKLFNETDWVLKASKIM